MGVGTGIEWADDTWNPTVGCSRVSPGCDACYAMTQAPRQKDRGLYEGVARNGDWTGRVNISADPDLLYRPIRQTRPRLIFVNSMSDLFHEAIPMESIARVWAVMALAHQHRFQVLTKRHKRMRDTLNDPAFQPLVEMYAAAIATENRWYERAFRGVFYRFGWPLPNVWVGVSVESEKYAFRMRYLQEANAAVRFVSAEPLIGPVDLAPYLVPLAPGPGCGTNPDTEPAPPALDWVIAGGESGRGGSIRPMHPDWVRSIRDQCHAAGVPFLFKQWGSYYPTHVFNDPDMAGGRAYHDAPGDSGKSAAMIHERNGPGHPRTWRMMEPGDRTNGGTVMLDHDWVAVQIDKHKAGRMLDGRLHDGYPESAVGRARQEVR